MAFFPLRTRDKVALAVVVTAGLFVAAMVGPGFLGSGCRGHQRAAKAVLRGIERAQQAYRAETATYGSLQDLRSMHTALRYDVVLVRHDAAHFTAEARGRGDLAGDVWRVDDMAGLVNVVDGCAGGR